MGQDNKLSRKPMRRLSVTFPSEDLERIEALVKEFRSQGRRTTSASVIRSAVHQYIGLYFQGGNDNG